VTNTHPFDVIYAALELRDRKPKLLRAGTQIRALCPAHPDSNPSLCVTRAHDRVLVYCHARCHVSAVVAALDLSMAALFVGDGRPCWRDAPQEIVASYPYVDLEGIVVAEKVRFGPRKTFKWRTTAQSGGDRWGLHGAEPTLYNRPALVEEYSVVVVEGEKAVDRLRECNIVATCGPNGAGKWKEAQTDALWRAYVREAVIIADNDLAGHEHALAVARSCAQFLPSDDEAPILVRLLRFDRDELPQGGDVVDWLDAGNSVEALKARIRELPPWHDESREDRKRRLNRERQRAFRERRRLRRQVTAAA
jgi:hypothetical protein